jgi:hypothetical protein
MRGDTYYPRTTLEGVKENMKRLYEPMNGFWIKSFLARRLRAIEPRLRELNEQRFNSVDIAVRMKISETAVMRYAKILGIVLHNRRQYLKPVYKWTPKPKE